MDISHCQLAASTLVVVVAAAADVVVSGSETYQENRLRSVNRLANVLLFSRVQITHLSPAQTIALHSLAAAM